MSGGFLSSSQPSDQGWLVKAGPRLTKANRDLEEALSQQRHGFLNSLQVVSGLLQLGRLEEAKEYVAKIASQIKEESSRYHTQPLEVVAKLSAWRHRLEANGARVSLELKADLSGWDGDPELLSDVLEAALSQLRAALEAAPPEQCQVCLRAERKEAGYMVQFSLPASVATLTQLTSGQEEIAKAGKAKLPVAIYASGDGQEMGWTVFLPDINYVL